MSVTLEKRKNGDGTTSLRLIIYNNRQRKVETLKHLQLQKGSSPEVRNKNADLLKQAKAIQVARAAELEASGYDLATDTGKKTNVIAWLKAYSTGYVKKDVRVMKACVNMFEQFLTEKNKTQMTFVQLTPLVADNFIDYLNEKCEGEGAASYYRRWKKAIRVAYKNRLMQSFTPMDAEHKPKNKARLKEVLSVAELQLLAGTHTEATQVRNAALFSAMTGLRWCDVKELKWASIDVKNAMLKFTQQKTGHKVEVPLNDAAMKLIGEPQKKNVLVFDLPSANGCNKSLKAWVKRAGIDKTITFHCLRHSFGTNIIVGGADAFTTSKLLGHQSLRYTQRYVHDVKELKRNATDTVKIDL